MGASSRRGRVNSILYTFGYTVLYISSAVFGALLGFATLRLLGVNKR